MKATSVNRFVFAALLCCGLCTIYSNARAQCPPDTIPSPGPAWSGPFTRDQEIYGGGCSVTETYCSRVVDDTTQYFLTSITPDSTWTCDTATWQNVINLAVLFFNGGQPDRNCPPHMITCDDPNDHPTVEEYTSSECFSLAPISSGPLGGYVTTHYAVEWCPGSTYCGHIYSLCCDNLGHIASLLVGVVTIPGGCNPSTNPPPTLGGEWVPLTCYGLYNCE